MEANERSRESKESNRSIDGPGDEKSEEAMLKAKGDMVNTMVPRGDSMIIKMES